MGWLQHFFGKRRVGPEWYREKGRISTRFSWGGVIAARVRGRTGTYVVFGSPRALDCSCHARQMPCPHVVAVGQELVDAPGGFVDLQARVSSLSEAAAVGSAIDRLVVTNPAPILDALDKGDFRAVIELAPGVPDAQAAAVR